MRFSAEPSTKFNKHNSEQNSTCTLLHQTVQILPQQHPAYEPTDSALVAVAHASFFLLMQRCTVREHNAAVVLAWLRVACPRQTPDPPFLLCTANIVVKFGGDSLLREGNGHRANYGLAPTRARAGGRTAPGCRRCC